MCEKVAVWGLLDIVAMSDFNYAYFKIESFKFEREYDRTSSMENPFRYGAKVTGGSFYDRREIKTASV
jgi:hypothetical protein